MNRSRAAFAMKAAIVVVLVGGCSFAVVRPKPSATTPPSCRGAGWGGLDLLGGVAAVAGTGLFAVGHEICDDQAPPGCETNRRQGVIIGLSIAGIYGASMLYGFVATAVCHASLPPASIASPLPGRPRGGR